MMIYLWPSSAVRSAGYVSFLTDYNIRLQKEYLISKSNLSDTHVGQLPNKSLLKCASDILVLKTKPTAISHSLYRLL